MNEPLTPPEAKALAMVIMATGTVSISKHAEKEMAHDELQTTDCINLIRAGVWQPPELEKGTWRYRVETPRICIVVAFASTDRLRLVTAWRKKQ